MEVGENTFWTTIRCFRARNVSLLVRARFGKSGEIVGRVSVEIHPEHGIFLLLYSLDHVAVAGDAARFRATSTRRTVGPPSENLFPLRGRKGRPWKACRSPPTGRSSVIVLIGMAKARYVLCMQLARWKIVDGSWMTTCLFLHMASDDFSGSHPSCISLMHVSGSQDLKLLHVPFSIGVDSCHERYSTC